MNSQRIYVSFHSQQKRLQARMSLTDDEHKILIHLSNACHDDRCVYQAQLVKLETFGSAPKLMTHIKKLVDADLVSRRVGQDQRSFELILTQRGESYIESLNELMTKLVVRRLIDYSSFTKNESFDPNFQSGLL